MTLFAWKWSLWRIKNNMAIFFWWKAFVRETTRDFVLRLTRVTSLLHVNSLWLCILYSFLTRAADQKIIFMFLITTKQVRNTVKFSIFTEKFTKIGLMNYADRGIASCSWCLVPGSRSKFGNWTTVPSVYIFKLSIVIWCRYVLKAG